MNEASNRVEKQILLKAARSKVWQALVNPQQFGAWFGVTMTGPPMTPGQHLSGNITHKGYEHLVMDIWIEKVQPQTYLSWRWHPAAIEVGVDYSAEATTLVEFFLEEVEGGTAFKVVETGFDRLPLVRRGKAIGMNSRGWEEQMVNIENYVATR